MELTDTEMHLLARLSRDRRLYAECKGADLDALEQVGLLQWFDARCRLHRLKKIRAHCSDCFYSAAGSIISGLHLSKTGASLSGQKSPPRLTRSAQSNGR
jgi:hypothetical protein